VGVVTKKQTIPTMNSARHTLKELLSDDKARLVLQHLIDITRDLDEEAHNELIIVSAQLKAYESRQVKGLAVFSELFVEKAKIHNALLHIIDNLPADVPDISVKKTEEIPVQNSLETVAITLPPVLAVPQTSQIVQQAKPYFSLAKWAILGSSIVAIATTALILSKNKETTTIQQTPSATTEMPATPSVSTAKPNDMPVGQMPNLNKTATASNVPPNLQKNNQTTVPTAANSPQSSTQNVEAPVTAPTATPSVSSNETAFLEENDWKSTETANTIEAYKQFLSKYPKSQHTTVATEMIDWKGVVKVNTLEGYTAFLQRFPNGSCQQKAIDRIAQLKAKAPFSDSRDQKTYHPALLGGKIWMTENLKYKAADVQIYDDKAPNLERLGGLYSLASAKSACPEGWHLPTDAEWQQLLNAFGGGTKAWAVLAKGGSSGFEALGSGFVDKDENMFLGLNEDAAFWTSSVQNGLPVLYYFDGGKKAVYRITTQQVSIKAASCRCVKN
jgi:uncharacterized protein (TIGR02145 family)